LFNLTSIANKGVNICILRRYTLAAICCLAMLLSFGQTHYKDSLLQVIKSNANSAAKINTLLLLSDSEVTDKKLALDFANNAYQLAVNTDNEKGKLDALIRISQFNFMLSDIKNAIETGLEAKNLAIQLDKKPELAIVLDGLGMLYYNLGDKKKCAEYYFSSLKLAEQLADKNMICLTLSRIGLLYNDQKDYEKADEYLKRSLALTKELDNKEGTATNLNNLANVAINKADYSKALSYLKEALDITTKTDNPLLEASHYLNIGKVYFKTRNFPAAMQYYKRALEIFTKTGNLLRITTCRLSIGEVELAAKNYTQANENITQALNISEKQGLKELIYRSYQLYHELSLAKKDTVLAYKYTILENQWKDSLALGENKQSLARMELQYHFEKKEQSEKAERERKTILNTAVIIALALSIIIILLIMNQLRLRAKKSKLEKEGLEKELDFKKKELTLNVMSLMKKSELLSDFSKKIVQFEGEATNEETKYALKRVGKELQKTAEEETLKEFSLRFKEVHKDFYDALLKKFPDLTPSELKLCAFLKLNLSTKEISELTGQRLNTLENARYRLRMKLGITNSEVNLVTFLSQI
jgi:tetratricopeptide (TPR) repeat protein